MSRPRTWDIPKLYLLIPMVVFVLLNNAALCDERHRVIVSTDIGGTDPDDFQSMVHLLV